MTAPCVFRVAVRRLTGFLWLALAAATPAATAAEDYFPPPDSEGGWRALSGPAEIRERTGIDRQKLDEVFEYIKTTTKHGGLLVARHGWLVYERYFGRGNREATPNTASCGKSFTSVAVGSLVGERHDLFPEGLDQKVFTPKYFPPEAFPLSDPRKAEIKLGQLLAMSAGIRGNNPGIIHGKEVTLDPPGPDGWLAMTDEMALGRMGGELNAKTLWCEPGGGYSYATSSVHLASIMLRHITGRELKDFVDEKLAQPMGWGRWGWGYQNRDLKHTPGGGGIAPRPADMLRFAYLLMRDGRWGNQQLVPAEYVRHCRRLSPYNPHYPYSLQFHVNEDRHVADAPRDAFWKPGSGGHCFYIIPSLDLVFYKMGGRDKQYDPANTGVPPPRDPRYRYDGSREGWKRTASEESEWTKTLRMVVASVAEK